MSLKRLKNKCRRTTNNRHKIRISLTFLPDFGRLQIIQAVGLS